MASVGCTLKLAEDQGDPNSTRSCDLAITGERRSGTWAIMSDSADARLAIGRSSGAWSMNEDDGGAWTAYIYGDDWRILLELYSLPGDFLSQITCTMGYSGYGWHQGPPRSDIVYRLWWGCG